MFLRSVFVYAVFSLIIFSSLVFGFKYDKIEGGDDFYLDAPSRVQTNDFIVSMAIEGPKVVDRLTFYDYFNNSATIHRTNFPQPVNVAAGDIYFYSFNISKNSLFQNGSTAAIRARTDMDIGFDEEGPIYVKFVTQSLPTFANWFLGDTHLHSIYSNNVAEFGARVNDTFYTLEDVGLNWATLTDHSFAMDPNSFNQMKTECNNFNGCIVGEEISCTWNIRGINPYSHFLGYDLATYIEGNEFEANLRANNLSCSKVGFQETVGELHFGYVAHPELGAEYLNDTEGFKEDPFRRPWRDYTAPYAGLQLWNEDDVDNRDLTFNRSYDSEMLRQKRRIYISAGTDSHGDFNHGFGSVWTGCYANPFSKENVLASLKNGKCYMSNGPALKMEHFGGGQLLMNGDIIKKTTQPSLNFAITYKSTEEFGTVDNIYVIKNGQVVADVGQGAYSGNSPIGWADNAVPNEGYYRLYALTSKGYEAFTNPIFITKPNISLSVSSATKNPNPNDNLFLRITAKNNNWQILNSLTLNYRQAYNDTAITQQISVPVPSYKTNFTVDIPIGKMNWGTLEFWAAGTDIFGGNWQSPIKKVAIEKQPLTSMDSDEQLKVAKFMEKYQLAPFEIYFDGRFDSTCDMLELRNNLNLSQKWFPMKCVKDVVNGTLVMWALYNNTGNYFTMYQIGNAVVDGNATAEFKSERFSYQGSTYDKYKTIHLSSTSNNQTRFEIAVLEGNTKRSGGENNFVPFGVNIIHGAESANGTTKLYYTSFNIFKYAFGSFHEPRNSYISLENEMRPFKQLMVESYNTIEQDALYDTRIYGTISNSWQLGINSTFQSDSSNNVQGYTVASSEPRQLFAPRQNPFGIFVYLGSPANLTITDAIGRKTGFANGQFINEIPGAEIIESGGKEKYFLPAGDYYFQINAFDYGTYDFKIIDENEKEAIELNGVAITPTSSDNVNFAGNSMEIATNENKQIPITISALSDSSILDLTYNAESGKTKNIDVVEPIAGRINQAPGIHAVLVENETARVNDTLNISIDAIDLDSGQIFYEIWFDDKLISTNSTATYNLNNATIGAHDLTLIVNDNGLSTIDNRQINILDYADLFISNLFIESDYEEVIDGDIVNITAAIGNKEGKFGGRKVKIDFSVDGNLIETLDNIYMQSNSTQNFTISWTATEGNHSMTVEAFDTTGYENNTELMDNSESANLVVYGCLLNDPFHSPTSPRYLDLIRKCAPNI